MNYILKYNSLKSVVARELQPGPGIRIQTFYYAGHPLNWNSFYKYNGVIFTYSKGDGWEETATLLECILRLIK